MKLVPIPFSSVEAPDLQRYDEEGDGWLSEKGSQYPHILTFKVKVSGEGEHGRLIDCLEILSHETKVPKKIDIDTEEGGLIHHLGYIVFNQGDGQSRELKNIPIGRKADVLRLTIHGCHENAMNPENQVGIAAIRLLGQEVPIAAKGNNLIGTAKQKVTNTLPLKIKNELDTKMLASVDRLDRLKKECAAAEDFDMAAKIKEELGKVYSLLIAFKESENQMKEAALEEDYLKASRLKTKRDEKRSAAKAALMEVEKQFAGNIESAANLSISTIKDHSFISERSGKEEQGAIYNTDDEDEEESTVASAGRDELSDANSSSFSRLGDNADHPLQGVSGAEELPSPDEIERDISTDLVQKVESLFGSYRAKCFFSKNWALREAVLAKMTLMMPEICSVNSTDVDVSGIIFSIIEQSNSDKNVQVNLSGLILLDEALLQLENSKTPVSTTPQLSRILVDLLSKMADNSKKVADSAEISLLALTHSSTLDVSYVALLATKRIRSKEAKGGRTLRARLQLLANLSAEFGVDVQWKKSIEFSKVSKAFDHRDGSVRDAAKALVLTLATIHGNEVFESLKSELAERQLRELQLGLKLGY